MSDGYLSTISAFVKTNCSLQALVTGRRIQLQIQGTLEQLIQHRFIHPKLTLRKAKDLVARLKGIEPNSRKANVRERLRRFAEFVRDTVTVSEGVS